LEPFAEKKTFSAFSSLCRFVLYSLESPFYSSYPSGANGGFFNWTMSYRRDADVYAPYGYVKKGEK